MTLAADWPRRESVIEMLLPGSAAPNRASLLAESSTYAREVVLEARHQGALTPSVEECSQALAWLNCPVLVCGHHRSGTTLVQELLDGHPELLVLPSEGTYFSSFSYAARPNATARDADRFIADWIQRLIDPNREPHFKLGRSGPHGNPSLSFARRVLGWQAVLREAKPEYARFALLLSLAAAFRSTVGSSHSPRRWVEKTPLNEQYVARFGALSQARFIHVVRDPRTTFRSLREIYRAAGNREFDAARHAFAIGRSLALAQRHREALGGRYLVVRYEDLLEAAPQEMERVRHFLEIAASASLSIPTVLGQAARSNSSFAKIEAGLIQSAQSPVALGDAELQLIGAFTAAAAGHFGYDIAPVSASARGLARIRSLPWLAREGLRHFR